LSLPVNIEWIAAHWSEAAMALSLAAWTATTFGSKRKYLIGAMLLVLASLRIIPVGQANLSLAAILAGAFGEISCLSVLLVTANFLPGWLPLRDRKLLALPVVVGLVLYWTVLTYGPFDLYRLGYLHASSGKLGSILFLVTLGFLSLMMPIRLMGLVALACLSWGFGMQASTNLWDYLLDVPSVLIYFGLLIGTFLPRSKQ
jgi:hypothetical protein